MKQVKTPTKQSLSIAVMALSDSYKGLTEDVLKLALKNYSKTNIPEVMTIREVKQKLKISEYLIKQMLVDGRLSGFPIGDSDSLGRRRWRIYKISVIEWIYRQGEKA